MRLDHFWDETNEGYHRQVNMGSQGASDATVQIDGVTYVKTDPNVTTSPEKVAYYKNDSSSVYRLSEPFNMVCAGLYTVGASPTFTITKVLSYNIDTTGSVARTSQGVYTITFDKTLGTTEYMVDISVAGAAGPRFATVAQADKAATNFVMRVTDTSNAVQDLTGFSFKVYK